MNNKVNDKDYIPLTPFKRWTLENFPFIEADFDAITNYQLYCKIVEYLNNIINNQNQVQELGTELVTAYNQLLDYVNNYFNNLDVQDEINTKLDIMAQDGTLASLINDNIFSDINTKIIENSNNIGNLTEELSNTIKTSDTNVITSSMLSQEVREALTGGSTAVVTANSISNLNLQNKSVSIFKEDDLLSSTKIKGYSNVSLPFNTSGYYGILNDEVHAYSGDEFTKCVITLDNNTSYEFGGYNNYLMLGAIITDSSDNIVFSTADNQNDVSLRYASLKFKTYQSGMKAYISAKNNTTYNTWITLSNGIHLTKVNKLTVNNSIDSEVSLLKTYNDKMCTISNVTVGTTGARIVDNNSSTVKQYKISKGTKYVVNGADYSFISGLCITTESGLLSYISSTSEKSAITPFTYIFTAENDGLVFLTDYEDQYKSFTTNISIVQPNLYNGILWTAVGDSMTDKSTLGSDVKIYLDYVSDNLKMNTQNLGVGGSGFYHNNDSNKAYWQRTNDIPVNSNIITLFGSFNDLTANTGDTLTIGEVTDNTTDTVCGCINQTISNVLTKVPSAIIGIITPEPWRYRNPLSGNAEICEEYVSKLIQIAKNHCIPVLDLYHDSNIRAYDSNFRTLYFVDDVHLNTYGQKIISSQIEEFIKRIYYI